MARRASPPGCPRRSPVAIAAVAFWLSASTVPPRAAAAPQALTLVFVDGRPAATYFNDGDTFEIVSGAAKGRRVRIAGVNTLEAYGPVHRWPGFSASELLTLAKMAALAARRGRWHCALAGRPRDAYGRTLAECSDLAEALVGSGLAHVFVPSGSAPLPLLAAQRAAIAAHRGMWAHGAPPRLLTSLHSRSERWGRGHAYDRVVSTLDGVASERPHRRRYAICETVCLTERVLTQRARGRVLALLAADPALGPALATLTPTDLRGLLDAAASMVTIPSRPEAPAWNTVVAALLRLRSDPDQWQTVAVTGTCMVYVPPELRYRDRPSCLRTRVMRERP
jgi:micrococcal nuclease